MRGRRLGHLRSRQVLRQRSDDLRRLRARHVRHDHRREQLRDLRRRLQLRDRIRHPPAVPRLQVRRWWHNIVRRLRRGLLLRGRSELMHALRFGLLVHGWRRPRHLRSRQVLVERHDIVQHVR